MSPGSIAQDRLCVGAWVLQFIPHLASTGMAGFVLANGSMSSNPSADGDIRKALIEADLVDCMVAPRSAVLQHADSRLPLVPDPQQGRQPRSQVRGRAPGPPQADAARNLGTLIDLVHLELTDANFEKITPGALRPPTAYADVAWFCKSATIEEIATRSFRAGLLPDTALPAGQSHVTWQ